MKNMYGIESGPYRYRPRSRWRGKHIAPFQGASYNLPTIPARWAGLRNEGPLGQRSAPKARHPLAKANGLGMRVKTTCGLKGRDNTWSANLDADAFARVHSSSTLSDTCSEVIVSPGTFTVGTGLSHRRRISVALAPP